MTPEERFERIERQIEFVVGQQVQFYADLRHLAEQVGRQERQIETQQGQIGQILGQIGQVVNVVQDMGGILQGVIRSQQRTEEHLLELGRRQQETDRRLNVLIDVIERHISGNGDRGPVQN
ncbi:MAG: hypothetical protein HY644_03110 [Acidobacteria bacterium]|nr:hypothetical protein [Acidobacteriota bacterium]